MTNPRKPNPGDALSATCELAIELINRASITPVDGGCQPLLENRLSAAGFNCESLPFGDVENLWARSGIGRPLLCFAGHTDVVPPGNSADWTSDPFVAEIRDDCLYGRGSADMKGNLAAMVTAAERFLSNDPLSEKGPFEGSIAFLITSDEEGEAKNGTRKVIEVLQSRQEQIDYCVVGEPSSHKVAGDTVRIGRRGSLNATLTVNGVQGHIAYPHLANNPIRQFAPALAELNDTVWDHGNEHFPPTTFEFSHLSSSSGADNVIPGILAARFNLRYSTEWDYRDLQNKMETILDRHGIDYALDWRLSGEPFLTTPGKLTDAAIRAIRENACVEPILSTGGGTSDGRFISPFGADVIEVGVVNATIHKTNEHIEVAELDVITNVYERIMELVLTPDR